jgi:ABC-type branched-subunit amino acid transport system ATPase component/sugar phosphate permease
MGVGYVELPLRDALRRGGWTTLALVFALNFVDEFENIVITVLGPDIQRTLHLSDTALTLLKAAPGFLVVLAAMPLGLLADRGPRVKLQAITSLIWAGAMFVSGVVVSLWQFAVARAFIGIGKGNYPISTALLTDAYPVGARTRVLGANNLANPLANLVGPLLVGGIAHFFGWRTAFIALSVPCVALGLLGFLIREPVRGANERAALLDENGVAIPTIESDPIPFGAGFTRLRQIKTFAALMASLGALGLALSGVPVVFNLVLERQYGLDAFGRGVMVTLISLGSMAGLAYGAAKGDALFRKDPASVLKLVAGGMAVFGVLFPLSVFMPNVWLLGLLQVIAGAAVAGPLAMTNALVTSVVPYRMRSFAFSVVGLQLVFVGGILGGVLTGSLSDAFSARTAIAVVVPASFGLAGLFIASAGRHVKLDMAKVVEELEEEQAEAKRMAEGGGSDELLQIRNLDFSYGPVQVLFDVELNVHQGEVLALLGTNGAGKSTVLRAISGLALPERGVIRYQGRTVTFTDATERVRRGIVQVPGGKAVFPTLTVRENLLAGAHTFIWDAKRLEAKSREVLELFPRLNERMDQPAGTLSGGEQQMLALAKALLLDPELLLIDELSLGLAPVMVQEILQTIDVLKQRGITMIVVEQSLNVALSISDRAVFMEKGRIRFEGSAAELMERDDLARAVFLGGEGG